MLRVTIEVLPGGDKSERKTLAVVEIANQSNGAPRSDYSVQIADEKEVIIGLRPLKILGFVRKEGFLALVSIALRLCVDEGMEARLLSRQRFYMKPEPPSPSNVYNAQGQPPSKPK